MNVPGKIHKLWEDLSKKIKVLFVAPFCVVLKERGRIFIYFG